jgi:hypothetical protein|tara:strand:- start:406 stop:606 length:201 start_codon:yes stop_codon:yes gene_type:complete
MKWDLAIRIGKYFGVIPEDKANEWVEDDYVPFYFELGEDGELFVVAGDADEEPEETFLEEDTATLA